MRIKTVPLLGGVKAGPDDGLAEGEFVVYPATFIRQADSYGDVIAKGAFLDTIAAWKDSGDTMPGLYGHRMDDPDFFVAGATDMDEDERGWRVRGVFDLDSPKAPQVYRLVKGRRLRKMSFAYDTLDEGQVELEDGTKANELRKLDVHEFSFVPIGANQDTSVVAVKALADSIEQSIKAGREISAQNIDMLTEVTHSLDTSSKSIKDLLARVQGEANDDGKASGHGPAKDEEPDEAKSEEPSPAPSANYRSAQMQLLALAEGEGGSP